MLTLTERLAAPDFEWLQAWLRERSGIFWEGARRGNAEQRLAPLLWRHKLPSTRALVGLLQAGEDPVLTGEVLDALTSGDTWFFRDVHPFELLRLELIPALIRARQPDRGLLAWSAGCSTGQEPYSLALLFHHHFLGQVPGPLRVIGTDVSEAAIERAREGLYTREEVNRGLPVALLARYFEKEGEAWRLQSALRQSVDFRVGRLDQLPDADGVCDLILLRNVVYHFDAPTRAQVLRQAAARLKPGGYLLLGSAERCDFGEGLEEIEAGKGWYYRRKD